MGIENVMDTLRNSSETLSTENLIILRNFRYWPQFLVLFSKISVSAKI